MRLQVAAECRALLEALADAEGPAPAGFREGLGEVLATLEADADAAIRDEAEELAGVLEAFDDE